MTDLSMFDQKLFNQEQFDLCKAQETLQFKCLKCNNIFNVKKHHIMASMSCMGKNGHKYKYCSKKCASSAKSDCRIKCICAWCKKTLTRAPSSVKDINRCFCCQSCSCKHQNANKCTGTRVSKLEKYIQQELVTIYPNIVFDFNKTSAIKSELDIYIPSLQLAFELNGIFHYEPIYGLNKLQSMKNNDNRKFQACIENGIELCIIDVSQQKKFSKETSQIFLNIIKSIISDKINT